MGRRNKGKKGRKSCSDEDVEAKVIQTDAPPAFGTIEYWDQEFESGIYAQPFDWVASWADLSKDIQELIPDKNAKILLPGCGNAPFQPDMNSAGYANMVCGDNSEVVINQMKSQHPHMTWNMMDATAMQFDDASFDVVLDKSLMDCLHCCDGAMAITRAYTNEVFRVLKPGGLFLRVSLHKERTVRAHNRGWDWKIESRLVNTSAPKEDPSQDTTWKKVVPADGGEPYMINTETGETQFEEETSKETKIESDSDIDSTSSTEDSTEGTFGGLPDGVALLCMCYKGNSVVTAEDSDEELVMPVMKKNNKKDKKKEAKNKRRLMALDEAELREEGAIAVR